MDHGKRWDGADPLPIDFPQVLPIHVVTASWERSRKRESHTREGRRLLADMLQFPDSPLLLPIGVLRREARSSLSDLSLDFSSCHCGHLLILLKYKKDVLVGTKGSLIHKNLFSNSRVFLSLLTMTDGSGSILLI